MLRSKPEAKAVLVTYLQQLRTARDPGLVLPKLTDVFPEPEEALANHLAQLEESEHATTTAKP
jgi:hypothetical protein